MNITRLELEKLYRNNPNKFVCEQLKITNPTLMTRLKEEGIPLKGSGNGKSDRRKLKVLN